MVNDSDGSLQLVIVLEPGLFDGARAAGADLAPGRGEAGEDPPASGDRARAERVDVPPALVGDVLERRDGPIELRRRVEQRVLARSRELVLVRVQAGQQPALARGDGPAEG